MEKLNEPWWGWIVCRIVGHRWKFVHVSLEGDKVFVCRRCGKHIEV